MPARSGRAARRLTRQSRRATHYTPATNPPTPTDQNPNPTQLLAEAQQHRANPTTHPNSLSTSHHHDPRLRRRQDQPDPHAREHPRPKHEQPLRRPRSILDSGLSRRNTVLRYPTRVYESDRASRTRQARRPLSRAHHARGQPTPPAALALTPPPPYELSRSNLDPAPCRGGPPPGGTQEYPLPPQRSAPLRKRPRTSAVRNTRSAGIVRVAPARPFPVRRTSPMRGRERLYCWDE